MLLSIAALAGAARADSRQNGIVDGRVVDAAGSAMAGIAVELAGERGEQTATTDADGRFFFGAVPAGDYVASVAVAAAATVERAVRLETGGRSTVDFHLDLATEERIDVVATAPLIDPHQPGAVSTLDGEVAAELVFATRNYQSVIPSFPGVVNPAGSLSEVTPSVNGGLWQENAAFLDGVDITDTRSGGSSRTFLPMSALAEVRSDASGYAVEYGRAVGGVTGVVTKSGTNQLHGDFLYVAQNPSWRAQSDVVPVDREDHLSSSYEASVGGPIVRDRAWFFAAAADNTTNQANVLAGGDVIDSSFQSDSIVGKLSLEASRRHRIDVTAIDGVISSPLAMPNTAERIAVSESRRGTSFVSASWGWTAGSTIFVEARAARQRASSDREQIAFPLTQPGASPDDPPGNQAAYWDNFSGLRWHASDLPLGPGTLEFPRDQANTALTWLLDRHELELGVDYQNVGWDALNRPPDRYLGQIYDQSRPGGFELPVLKRVFVPIDSPVGTESTSLALFAQDRADVGDRLSVSFGLRLDDQAHDDERGNEVLSSTDLAPRAAAVYDVSATGMLLVKATAGRYFTHIAQDFLNQEFASLPNGANAFDEFLWNPATLRYDVFNRRQLPPFQASVQDDVEPYAKDEVTLGLEWQASSAWAFQARAIAWRIEAPFSATNQFDAEGGVYRLLTSFAAAEREYRALQFELDRAFRAGLVVRANYTLSRVDGNSIGSTGGGDDFLEARDVLDPVASAPVTAVNRHGRLSHDRTHILNLSGAKRWTLGDHGVALGGWLAFRSGEPWGLQESVALRSSPTSATILTTRFIEPRDRNELPDIYTLNLTAAWERRLAKRASGSLRVELANATDQQEQIDVSAQSGRPIPVPQSYQTARELRFVLGVRF